MKPHLTRYESTGGWERHGLPFIISALAVIAGPSVSAGQTSVLDRVVRPDHLGAPVVWIPDSAGSGLFARRVAQSARVPVVFEVMPTVGAKELPARLDLTGMTVRAALDEIVAADPRYEWRLVEDTVVVRPVGAWTDASHPFHGLAVPEVPGEQPLSDALRRAVGGAGDSSDMAALAARVDRGRRVRSPAGARAILERVAELAAEGNLFVQLTDARADAGAVLEISTWAGEGYRITGPGRSIESKETSR